MEAHEGQTLEGRYRIEGVISVGGNGRVYRGVQEAMGREVAIKVLRTELVDDEKRAFENRFFREAQLTGQLQHPNIVTIHDYGKTAEGDCYIVMELLKGRSLRDAIRPGVLPIRRSLKILDQVAQGLRHAHAHGLVHRDIKPGNIFLVDGEGEERAKILDFGLVRVTGAESAVTEVGTFMGTPQYMSPEQAKGLDADARADLYSLGVLLYRLLTGTLPFTGSTLAALAYLHVNEPFPTMKSRAPQVDVPPELEEIARRCMEKDPERRFTDADAFLQSLRLAARKLYGSDLLPAPEGVMTPPPIRYPTLVPPPGTDTAPPPPEPGEPDGEPDTDETDARETPPRAPIQAVALPAPAVSAPAPASPERSTPKIPPRPRKRSVLPFVALGVIVVLCGGGGTAALVARHYVNRALSVVPEEVAVVDLSENPAPESSRMQQVEEWVGWARSWLAAHGIGGTTDDDIAVALAEPTGLQQVVDAAREANVPGQIPPGTPEIEVQPGGRVDLQPGAVPTAAAPAVTDAAGTDRLADPSVEELPGSTGSSGSWSESDLTHVPGSTRTASTTTPTAAPAAPTTSTPPPVSPAPASTPRTTGPAGHIFVDDIGFTADEAARTLQWVNTASDAQLKAAGVRGQQVGVILQSRPYATIQAFGATSFIGTKTVEIVKIAATP